MAAHDRYVLMCKNHAIARFTYGMRTRSIRELEQLDGARFAPPATLDENGLVDQIALSDWISRRCIPHAREGISDLLHATGCSNPAELMFRSLGLNLSDQYRFKPEGLELDWHEVNYVENTYDAFFRQKRTCPISWNYMTANHTRCARVLSTPPPSSPLWTTYFMRVA